MNDMNDLKKELDKIKIPESLSQKTFDGIQSAKNEMRNGKKNTIFKRVSAAVILLAIVGGTCVHSIPSVNAAVMEILSYFSGNTRSKFAPDASALMEVNKNVEMQSTDKNISLIINNVSMDGSIIHIFYTITSTEAIPKNYIDDFRWPFLKCFVDGEEVIPSSGSDMETEAYFVDDYTIKGLERKNLGLLDLTGDQWQVDISSTKILGETGDWHTSFVVDKAEGAAEAVVYYPSCNFSVPDFYWDYTHDVAVEKVVLSPLGNSIVLQETGNPFTPIEEVIDRPAGIPADRPPIFRQFTLMDPDGKVMNVIDKGTQADANGDATNMFEFLNARPDMEFMTLVPFQFAESVREGDPIDIMDDIGDYPIRFTLNNVCTVVITNVEITEEKITVDYYYDGVCPFNGFFNFYNAEGERIKLWGSEDYAYSRTTGQRINIYPNEDDFFGRHDKLSKEEIDSIVKIGIWPDNDIILRHDYAVRIDLNKK